MFVAPVLVTRMEAKALGLVRYYTGKPCKQGHLAERLTSNGGCLTCQMDRQRANKDYYVKWAAENAGRIAAYRATHRDEQNARNRRRDPEKLREKSRAYRAANREKTREVRRKWRRENPAKHRENEHSRRAADPEKARAKERARWAANPEQHRANGARRRARKKGAEVTLTRKLETKIRASATHCYYCKTKFERDQVTHLDHVVPLIRGGAHSETNVVVSCATCNLRKRSSRFNPVTQQGILL